MAGGAVVAAAGSVLLVCLTAKATLDGTQTPLDVADTFYGTHFNDSWGWLQGQYAADDTSRLHIFEVDTFIRQDAHGAVSIGTGASEPAMELATSPQTPPGALPKQNGRQSSSKKTGRIYVTYTKFNRKTSRHYSGRTSMVSDLEKPLEVQAALAVAFRDLNHHLDESDEPEKATFEPATVDVFDVGLAVDYDKRYEDAAYWRIRGREQQLIDSHGGAQSDTGKPYRTENIVRAVAKDNPLGRRFHEAATKRWSQLHSYTGH